MKKNMKLLDIKRISKPAAHSAFTDLIENPFDKSSKTLLCCYRQATNHVSADGLLIILTIDKKSFRVLTRVRIQENDADLRDPKFSYDGKRLILTTYAKTYLDSGKMVTKMLTYFSTTGQSWSGKNSFGNSGWWLWNHAWFNSQAYGFAYNRPSNTLSLYKGDPTRTMQLHKDDVFNLNKQGKGYPNESTILFNDKGNASVFLRRDADSFSAQFGTSKPPYTKWEWHDLGIYIGGPAAVALSANLFIVAGRHVDWETRQFTTKIWLFDSELKKLTQMYTLPSSGDTSYPGLVVEGDHLYVSYYSCHVDDQARVYIACLTGVNALIN
ncbi:hypothetical protein FJN13_04265 [Alteromonas mediterranea]|uniref:hypothetical protein n=1 Tax=Alteromonas mediterranea TaxID=314275 RepID=UPI001131F39A|nr:hypothetical protein [Alteromonas mediterranea]QDG34063.1 hypothetical protein FJN13_04265 [Alteromonas mediterranea]